MSDVNTDVNTNDGDRLTLYLHELSADTDNAVTSRVYAELRNLVQSIFGDEHRRYGRSVNSRNVTTVIHDCWLRLQKREQPWDSHFFGAASLTVRRLLVDEARRRRSRGQTVTIDESEIGKPTDHILSVDKLLGELHALAPRPARILSYRLFGGLRSEVIAELEGVAERTVQRDLAFAEAWMKSELGQH